MNIIENSHSTNKTRNLPLSQIAAGKAPARTPVSILLGLEPSDLHSAGRIMPVWLQSSLLLVIVLGMANANEQWAANLDAFDAGG